MACTRKHVIISVIGCLLLVTIIAVVVLQSKTSSAYVLNIVHFNDFHSKFEETSPQSARCTPTMDNCVGGFARMYKAITDLMKTVENPILLNAGDNLQGSAWYRIFKWNVSTYFLNFLPVDAYTLGNHEFEDGIDGVLPYIQHYKAPGVVANMDASLEPRMQGILNKSIILERNGKRIGIIGVITTDTPNISKSEKLIFLDEVTAVKEESKRLKLNDKCDIIIVLSHCGTEVERSIAAKGGPYIHVIVGGHSHSLYYNGNPPDSDIVEANYPDVVQQKSGRRIPIVQSYCFSKYIGHLNLKFDKNNEIIEWEGNSIYMSHDSEQDEFINRELLPWKKIVDAHPYNALIGASSVELNNANCSLAECIIGNFYADAMVTAWDEMIEGLISLMVISGIRASLPLGNITMEDLLISLPYRDTWDCVELQGKHLVDTLEFSARGADSNPSLMKNLLQVSGLKYTINITEPNGKRVKDVQVSIKNGSNISYNPINVEATYSVVMQRFIAEGNAGFSVIRDNKQNHRTGPKDKDVLLNFFKNHNPIVLENSNRITIVK